MLPVGAACASRADLLYGTDRRRVAGDEDEPKMDYRIRDAEVTDLPAINEIYNHYVRRSTATFHEQPVTAAERDEWWRERAGRFPVLVAVRGDNVLGWGDLGPHKSRCAYRFTVENSIYLRPEACGQGIGKALLGELLKRGEAAEFHNVLAVIAADQEPSIRLHARAGYREVGRLREVGHKFNRWLDVIIMQRPL
jgi:phosphinothricin acetyltransferase